MFPSPSSFQAVAGFWRSGLRAATVSAVSSDELGIQHCPPASMPNTLRPALAASRAQPVKSHPVGLAPGMIRALSGSAQQPRDCNTTSVTRGRMRSDPLRCAPGSTGLAIGFGTTGGVGLL